MLKAAIIAAVALVANAVELTPETYGAATAGKTVFLKFFAPWYSHCRIITPQASNPIVVFVAVIAAVLVIVLLAVERWHLS
jgi:thiol-disulfide isomerase/thioredoxin